MTILEAAKKIGIEIPVLCHEEGLKPRATVGFVLWRWKAHVHWWFLPHAYFRGHGDREPLSEVLEARRATIELLLTGHTGSCVTDTEARECTLHKLASDLEAGPPRFHVKRPASMLRRSPTY